MENGKSRDSETLKQLNFKQKLRFCLDYYKGYFFVLFVMLLVLFYIGDMVYQSRQVIDLQGFFVNDQYNLFPAGELSKDYSQYANTPLGHRVAFEDSLFVDLESGSEYHAASQSKIVAYASARELDFLIVPESLALTYSQSFPLYDMNLLLPEDLKDRLKDSLYLGTDGTGEGKAWGLNLKDSRLLKNAPPKLAEPYCFLVFGYCHREEAVRTFLRYCYEE